jgi:uncharacterized protein YbaA (DUF1428 family)
VANIATDLAAEFEQELQVFDNDVDEVVQCFYIWRTVHAAARTSRKVYDLLNRNAGFWVVALGSIQANSLIALGRIFDKGKDTHNLRRLLKLAEKNKVIFSKDAVRQRKTKDLANASHLIDDYMSNVQDPTPSDFNRLQLFVDARRKVYERCYKQLRDKRYAHKERTNISGFVAQTNLQELARLVTDLRKLHRVLWDWHRNGLKPRTSRLRGTAGKQIQRDTRKFLKSLISGTPD